MFQNWINRVIQGIQSNVFFGILITISFLFIGYIISVLAGATPNPFRIEECQVIASEITISRNIVYLGESVTASVLVANPDGNAVIYNWYANLGKMVPNNKTPQAQSTYTAPLQPTEDTISVDITVAGCITITKRQQVSIVVPPPAGNSVSETANRAAPILIQPQGDIAFGQFDYDPGYAGGSLRLFVCVNTKYYRITSTEIEPNPRPLFDDVFSVTQPCEFKYPVTGMQIGDIETVGIGASDEQGDTYDNVIYFTVKRTENGLELVTPSLIPTPIQ